MAGNLVQAMVEIAEVGFSPEPDAEPDPDHVHVHAVPGDYGAVQARDGEWATVTWIRTGSTTDCHEEQFRVIK